MPVDEFGREVPAATGGGNNSVRDEFQHAPAPRRHSTSPSDHRHGDRSYSSRRRDRRDSSAHGGSQQRSPRQHASQRYAQEPMLCEFVWKSQQGQDDETEKKKESDDDKKQSSAAYDAYRRQYCLSYVRSFFNKHLDDSWFRAKNSPVGRKQRQTQEQQRAAQEAQAMLEAATRNAVEFVQGASLSGGKPGKTLLAAGKPASEPPSTHQLALLATTTLLVTDIAPHVTDQQLQLALLDHMNETATLDIYHTSPQQRPSSGHARTALQRQALVSCPENLNVLLELWNRLHQGSSSSSHNNNPYVPRKDNTHDEANAALWVPLDVDCTDPYGRLEYDANGQGGAPADGLAVPPRKSTVRVRRSPQPPVLTLLAAVSSTKRIPQDKEAAVLLARALDVKKQVPEECRLDHLLTALTSARSEDDANDAELSDADVLDVAIAYLRRVHLLSFYHSCSPADSIADVVGGTHPASTIYMRLQNADEIVQEAAGEQQQQQQEKQLTDDAPSQDKPADEPKDLLVQRLDDSIAEALQEYVHSAGHSDTSDIGNDEDVQAIQQAERQVENQWLRDHSILDDDGRARCSFHFCHKLFKDSSFLQKHLLKKHREYLVAEQAKCHDEYMMKAWDAESNRPVPDVLVDCGAVFGLVASPVTGQEPMATDPEPNLWKQQEADRQREAEQRKQQEEMRQQRHEQRQQQQQHPVEFEGDGSRGGGGVPSSGFVDVDDMKEETIEVSFDNLEVPVALPKKKKKKRKLL